MTYFLILDYGNSLQHYSNVDKKFAGVIFSCVFEPLDLVFLFHFYLIHFMSPESQWVQLKDDCLNSKILFYLQEIWFNFELYFLSLVIIETFYELIKFFQQLYVYI